MSHRITPMRSDITVVQNDRQRGPVRATLILGNRSDFKIGSYGQWSVSARYVPLAMPTPGRYSIAVEQIVAADIGGTHARFALATVAEGRVVDMASPVTLRTEDHASFQAALAAALPDRPSGLALAFAGPVDGDLLHLTNNRWTIARAALPQGRVAIVNDFGAVAHAVAGLPASGFRHICGPETPLPTEGVVSVVGPGTGLGVALLVRDGSDYRVIETEGGHIGFAPADEFELRVLALLRSRFGRVSVERIVSGPGLRVIAEVLGCDNLSRDDAALWAAALDGSEPFLAEAVDRLCGALASAAGDLALAHGADALVIAGGIGARLGSRLVSATFAERFAAKGRFAAHMHGMPVKLLTHPQPGLYGAAAAFARKYC